MAYGFDPRRPHHSEWDLKSLSYGYPGSIPGVRTTHVHEIITLASSFR